MDPNTGLITGTILYTAAAGSPHDVSVWVFDGLQSIGTSFIWTIANTNQPPVLVNPGAQDHLAGDEVVLQLDATEPDGDSIDYGATNLPPGLVIDGSTGTIEGRLRSNGAGTYTVTVSASDGTLSSEQTFLWTVRPRS